MNRFLHNLADPRKVWEGLKNPHHAYAHIINNLKGHSAPIERMQNLQQELERNRTTQIREVSGTLGVDPLTLRSHVEEISTDVEFQKRLDTCREVFDGKPFVMGGIEEAALIYAVLRVTQPKNVLEVGVANGVSSYYVLKALERNGAGNLVSIDIPKYERNHSGDWHENAGAWIPEGKDVGWIVPSTLRSRWRIILGDVREQLPEIVDTGPAIDGFVYDGPKGYYWRKWAFERVHDGATGAVYVCDDIAWNDSFQDFAREHSISWEIYGNVGIAFDDSG